MLALVSLSDNDFPFESRNVCGDVSLAFQWDILETEDRA